MKETKKSIDIWSIFIYLILYSIAGFIIETVFGAFTKGVIESRKSFLYGPFCAIYGIGAVSMIIILKNQKSVAKLFFGGAVIGAIVEYLMSLICEVFFGVKWWDYSSAWLNIAGRTCIGYAFSWGLLAILLIKFVNPQVDKFIDYLKQKNAMFKAVTVLLVAFFAVDAGLTGYALKVFYYRVSVENNLNIHNKDEAENKYARIKSSDSFAGFINNYYDDKKMIKTYPNIMIEDKTNQDVYIESLVDDVKPYYYRIGEAF